MKLQKIVKKETGNYITRYDISYETEQKHTKVYEMISRNPQIQTAEELRGTKADAVVIIAVDESGEHILLAREFRLAPGEWVYNFPAGLIDDEETPAQSAVRELQEETGLELYEINDTLPLSYSAVGFSNEMNVCIIGKARGTFRKSTSEVEEIHAGWYSKEDVRNLLKTERFAARTQAYCHLWSK